MDQFCSVAQIQTAERAVEQLRRDDEDGVQDNEANRLRGIAGKRLISGCRWFRDRSAWADFVSQLCCTSTLSRPMGTAFARYRKDYQARRPGAIRAIVNSVYRALDDLGDVCDGGPSSFMTLLRPQHTEATANRCRDTILSIGSDLWARFAPNHMEVNEEDVQPWLELLDWNFANPQDYQVREYTNLHVRPRCELNMCVQKLVDIVGDREGASFVRGDIGQALKAGNCYHESTTLAVETDHSLNKRRARCKGCVRGLKLQVGIGIVSKITRIWRNDMTRTYGKSSLVGLRRAPLIKRTSIEDRDRDDDVTPTKKRRLKYPATTPRNKRIRVTWGNIKYQEFRKVHGGLKREAYLQFMSAASDDIAQIHPELVEDFQARHSISSANLPISGDSGVACRRPSLGQVARDLTPRVGWCGLGNKETPLTEAFLSRRLKQDFVDIVPQRVSRLQQMADKALVGLDCAVSETLPQLPADARAAQPTCTQAHFGMCVHRDPKQIFDRVME